MAGRSNRPLWDTSDVDRKPLLSYKPNPTDRHWHSTDSFLPSGAVEYRPSPGPVPTGRTNVDNTMSGNSSGSRSGTVPGAVPSNTNANDRGKGKATYSPLDARYGAPYPHDYVNGVTYGHGGPPQVLPPMSTFSTWKPHPTYEAGLIDPSGHGSAPGPSRRPGLLSPFAPAYHPSTSTYPPAEPVARVRPLVSPSGVPGNASAGCHCLVCSDSTPTKCFQSQLARQYELMATAWEEEHTHVEQFRLRMEGHYREEARITLEHYRGLWANERLQMESEISYLSEQVRRLGDENLQLKGKIQDQAQGGEPIIHHGSFQDNTPLVDGSPPSPLAGRQSGSTRGYNGARGSCSASGVPSYYSNLFGIGLPASPQTSTLRNPSPLGTSVSPPASAPPSLPSTRVSMSPQPGQDTIPMSPVFFPYSSSPSPYPETGTPPSVDISAPVRSPKRPISVIDVHELDPKLEGISLRASAVRKTTFEETRLEGSPPTKRQRSLSHDYYIVTNLRGEGEDLDESKKEEDEETDVVKKEEDEERRLIMHAGYTPNHSPSPSLPLATTSGPSQGSATPTASSTLKAEDGIISATATATATAEPVESSGASYASLSHDIGGVETSSSGSCSQGALSEASGDVGLKGPLMIKNIPAQDELFLAALNERLEPISQGQDALPRAVQTPTAMPASLSAVFGGPFDGADAKHTAAPDNTDVSGTQSEVDEEHDGVHVKMEHMFHSQMHDNNVYAYDGTRIKKERQENPFATIGESFCVEPDAPPLVTVKREDPDEDSDTGSMGAEVAIKFKSTSNFGAPFGRM
ncbi:hypothetical protein V8C42DRAFT_262580 [Trichoderma barbatum]